MLSEEDIAHPNAQRRYRQVGTAGDGLFLGCDKDGFLQVSASD